MKKATVQAVEMVRRIRDTHYEQLLGKGPEERIAFYCDKARLWHDRVEAMRQRQAVADPK
jgi:hypothetical protein